MTKARQGRGARNKRTDGSWVAGKGSRPGKILCLG